MSYPDYMPLIERKIVDKVLKRAFAKGYLVSVYDGEEWPIKQSADYEAITKEIAATDMTILKFRSAKNGDEVGRILLIHGNHEDVISDCTDNEAMLELAA